MEELNTILNMFENCNYQGGNKYGLVLVTRKFLKDFCKQVDVQTLCSNTITLGSVTLPVLDFTLPYPYRIYCTSAYLLPIRYKDVEFSPILVYTSMFPEASSEEQIYKMSQLKAFT